MRTREEMGTFRDGAYHEAAYTYSARGQDGDLGDAMGRSGESRVLVCRGAHHRATLTQVAGQLPPLPSPPIHTHTHCSQGISHLEHWVIRRLHERGQALGRADGTESLASLVPDPGNRGGG